MANFSDVFISYSRRNTAFARRLFDALKLTGRESWADWEDIPLSVDWWSEIKAGIDGARIFVFIITPDSLRSEVCNRELEYARVNNKRIVPVINHDVSHDTLDQIWAGMTWEALGRENWMQLQRLNWLFFRESDDFDLSFADLVKITEEDPEQVRMHTWLLVRARDWDENGRGASRLLTGQEINEAQAWLEVATQRPPHPTHLHHEYIAKSIQVEESRRRLLRNLRRATMALGLVGVLAIAATVFALIQAGRAQQQVSEALTNLTAVGLQLGEVNVTLDEARNAQAAAQVLAATAEANAARAAMIQGQAQQEAEQAQQALRQANTQVAAAGTDAALLGEVLTPIPLTLAFANEQLAESANQAERAQKRADEAGTLVAEAQVELTRIPPTLTQVDNQRRIAEANAASVSTQAAQVLSGVQRELATATAQLADSVAQAAEAQVQATAAEGQAATAQAQALQAQQQAAEAQVQATAAQGQAATAQAQAATAQAQAAQAQQQAAEAQVQAATARQALVESAREATQAAQVLDEARSELATATLQIADSIAQAAIARQEAESARDQALAAQAQATIVQQQAHLAETRVAQAENDLLQIAPALTEAAGEVSTAQAEAQVFLSQALDAQAQALDAQAQAQQAQIILTPLQSTLAAVDNQARSQSLAVNAQQALGNNNYDIAIALLLESSRINPDLTLTQRLLSQAVYNTARFSFDQNTDAAFRPDLPHIAESAGPVIGIHDLTTRQQLYRLQGHTATVRAIAFNPAGNLLVSAGEDGRVILWDVSGSAAFIVSQFTDHNAPVRDVQFNPDGSHFASVGDDNRALLWDVASLSLHSAYSSATGWPMTRVQFNANGQRFFTWEQAGANEVIRQWAVGQSNETWSSANRQIYQHFSPDLRLAVDDTRNALVVWNAQTQGPERVFDVGFRFDVDRITHKALRPVGGDVLVSVTDTAGGSGRLLLLDLATQRVEQTFTGLGSEAVTALAFNALGNRVLSGYGRSMVLWDVDSGQAIQEFFAHNDTLNDISFSPDGRYALSRSRDGNACIWEMTLEDPNAIGSITAPVNQFARVRSPGFSPDGSTVYGAVWIDLFSWAMEDQERRQRLTMGNEIINALYSPTEPLAVLISTNAVSLWDTSQPPTQAQRGFLGSSGSTYTGIGAISADGQRVVVDSNNSELVVRGLSNERLLTLDKSILGGRRITALAFTPDNRSLIAATVDSADADAQPGPLIVWNLATGKIEQEINSDFHTRRINHLALSPDSTLLLTASSDSTLVIWTLENGRFLRRLSGHSAPVNVGLFSPDANTVFSASDDRRVIQWSVESGQVVRIYSGHSAPVTGLALRPDGQVFASSTGVDREPLILWRVDSLEQLVEWTRANRYVYALSCDEQNQFNIQSQACGTLAAAGAAGN